MAAIWTELLDCGPIGRGGPREATHARAGRLRGADVVDEPAVTDGNIITSRMPDDVPAFTEALIKAIER